MEDDEERPTRAIRSSVTGSRRHVRSPSASSSCMAASTWWASRLWARGWRSTCSVMPMNFASPHAISKASQPTLTRRPSNLRPELIERESGRFEPEKMEQAACAWSAKGGSRFSFLFQWWFHHPRSGARGYSRRPVTPSCFAQCTQQKMVPFCSTPCPMMRVPQCGHVGASAWIAHSKLSKIIVRPPMVIAKLLS